MWHNYETFVHLVHHLTDSSLLQSKNFFNKISFITLRLFKATQTVCFSWQFEWAVFWLRIFLLVKFSLCSIYFLPMWWMDWNICIIFVNRLEAFIVQRKMTVNHPKLLKQPAGGYIPIPGPPYKPPFTIPVTTMVSPRNPHYNCW